MNENTKKTVAITGSCGGLGKRICLALASRGYDLIFIDRNREKSERFADQLKAKFATLTVTFVTCDLTDTSSVKAAIERLLTLKFDTLLLNSGVYNVPIVTCDTGYNNVFQVNFVSQYAMVRQLIERGSGLKKVVAISSVAHRYGVLDENDIDYSTRKKPSKIYGNSKRFLTFSLYEYFKDRTDVSIAVAHPGVTLTNMTNHYPKFINPIVKLGIKLVFPSPDKAIRSIVCGVEERCDYMEWIGPRVFDVWGLPKKIKLKSCSVEESEKIAFFAQNAYERWLKTN